MQSLLRLAFPPQCVGCGALVEQEFALCGECWRNTPFVGGLVCDTCGVPLPGDDAPGPEYCDDCLAIARPWQRGRAATLYRDTARRLVLALKHGDRLDLARVVGRWLSAAAEPLLVPGMAIVPVPAHPLRLLARRYNQAAVLANAVARETGHPPIPDLLGRSRRTPVLDGLSRDARFSALDGAIRPARHATDKLGGRPVLLIDDVMTSGATLAAATEAARAAGADHVCVVVLARVAKDT